MYYFVPLSYKDTLQVMSYLLLMKNIAIWPYKEIALWPYHALLHGVRHPKTHLLLSCQPLKGRYLPNKAILIASGELKVVIPSAFSLRRESAYFQGKQTGNEL